MNRAIAAATAVLLSCASAAAAQPVLYDCDLKADRAMGWVSSKMALYFDGQGGAEAIDGVILGVVGNPLKVRARKRGDTVRLNWTINGATDTVGTRIPTISYITRLNTGSNEIYVVAKPAGYPQRFSARGTCALRTDAKDLLRP